MSEENKNHNIPEETVQVPKSLVVGLMEFAPKEFARQRRDRYIGYALKALFAAAFLTAAISGAGIANKQSGDIRKEHIAYVEISGPIMPGQVDADKVVPALTKAFENKNSKAVVLRVNSPGGSPTQASIIYDEIQLLKKKYPEKKLYAAVEDLCASACYWIISSADKIYVDKTSLVGSIGVITSGFGFSDVMKKVGVEHRVITAGENKNLLDPYSPENPHVTEYFKKMLADLHLVFIATVEAGRGARLHKDYPELYSGLIWTGQKAVEIGLCDSLGSLNSISRETLNGELNSVNYTPSPDILKQISSKAAVEIDNLRAELLTPKLF